MRPVTQESARATGSGLVAKIRRSLDRDSDLPLAQRVRKGFRYAAASAAAPFYLGACDRVGARARVLGRPVIDNHGRIEVGDDFNLNSYFAASELGCGPQGVLEIGSGVTVNFGVSITARRRVQIGDHVMVGPYSIIADLDVAESTVAGGSVEPEPIQIGDNVWLAGRVTVLPGTTIGEGSVITTGSIVSGTIPPRVVAGGIPARVLRRISADDRQLAGEAVPDAPADSASAPAVVTAPRAGMSAASATTEEEASGTGPSFHGLLISDFTIDGLAQKLGEAGSAPSCHGEIAPFGQVMQTLLELGQHAPDRQRDFGIVWTRPEAVVPSFHHLASFEPVDPEALLQEVDAFCTLIAQSCEAFRFLFVPSWAMPPSNRGLGLIDMKPEMGVAHALMRMNLRLTENLARLPNVYVLNTQRWTEAVGWSASNPKLWYLGKVAFHSDVFSEAAKDIHAALSALTGNARKLIILDLDDTLWGGVVGDVGWQNLRLGGHDGVGEALVDFQRHLKNLTRRGVLLAIASKNEEAVALEAIRNHPEMVLRLEDFAGWKISWRDKAQNIAELLAELNLGAQSAVFIDDNPAERARVRESLPEVLVPEWPEDQLLYTSALQSLRCFDTPAISKEDAERTQMYVSGRQREELKRQVGSLEEWLATLQMKVRVEPLQETNLQRATQLLNKTNQMNLTTRRMTETELMSWAKQPGHHVWCLSVTDRFGDSGLTGIVSVAEQEDALQITDFILSCRVMGRKIEECMVHLAVAEAQRRGVARVIAVFIPTAKNKPCLDFWKGSKFDYDADTQHFSWHADTSYAAPEHVLLETPS